jgi:hypothetical protein
VAASGSRAYCSTTSVARFVPHVYAGSRFSRLLDLAELSRSLNGSCGKPVVPPVASSRTLDHGGYMIMGNPVGTRRLMNRTAVVRSLRRRWPTPYNRGQTARRLGLNTYLQQNKGYEPERVAIVKSVWGAGSSINLDRGPARTKLNVGVRVPRSNSLGQRRTTNPHATYQVTVAGLHGAGDSSRHARTAQRCPRCRGTRPSFYW